MSERHYETLLETADAMKLQDLSPVDLTEAMLQRIASLDPILHAFATVTADVARAQASQAEAEIARGDYRGPLHGVPIAVKDIVNTAGVVTAAGMPINADNVPDFDATVYARLKDAGAILLGNLQLTEGAFVNHHPDVTVPVNPWHEDYYAGASSSGSGVATAAGLCFASLGSDTGGSIRFPSAANGITGLKPTWGRVSRHGVFALADSLDHIGPMTRSAADAAAILAVIAGRDPKDPTTLAAPVPDYLASLDRGVRGIRIGLDRAYNEDGCDPDVIGAVSEARRVLESLGAELVETTLPDPESVIAAWGMYCSVETAIAHEATYPARAAGYGGLAGLIEAGKQVGGVELMKAHHDRLIFSGALSALFTQVDLLLIPTQPRADFTIREEQRLFSTSEGLAGFLRYATPFDMSGSPTITLPAGFTAKGLPLSFQLVGRHLGEELLLRAGHAYQRVTDWHRRHPTL
ncbi:amidase [Rhizobium sp. ERR 1071]|uniref:amidase n=1 Tax=Rhizobium sp. ERR 1071 TaxID=2572677 RepID=UPI001198D2D4|nr:amidase [Rhizobium sp. ERR1071]TWB09540.1 amidase [Rhizobium sp. ERR1071]